MLAAGLGRRLVRLQCYDGLDLSAAAYEWDHARQLMAIRIAEAAGDTDRHALARDIYTREFLQARPLLSAIDPDLPPAVLLIDELDRADEPFEAFLLEVLARFPAHRAGIRHHPMRATHAGGRARPPTARARCMTRSAGAACITGSTTPMRRASARSWPRKAPGRAGAAVGPGGRLRAAAARRGPVQAARRGRDDRLGRGADAISTSTNWRRRRSTRRSACC